MLTETKIKAAKPDAKAYRLPDSGGLYVHVMPGGSKIWRLRYRIGGKEQTLTIGAYPDISLRVARERRDAAKDLLRQGINPSADKQMASALAHPGTIETFETVAREWYGQRKDMWRSKHAVDVITSLERDVFPLLGKYAPSKITPKMTLHVLRLIEDRGAIETAHRVRQRMSEVFVHAIATDRAETDPAAIVKPALRPVSRGHQPAITDLDKARAMISKIEEAPSHPVTQLGLRLLYLTGVRPGEVRGALWEEFHGLDTQEPTWIIPAERMKMAREHIVPLSRQAVETIEALRPFSGRFPHLFPNARRPMTVMSENAIGYLINRAGFHHRHVPHGFRATFSSVMNERYKEDHAIIELMLAHISKDKVAGAYNRALHLERRRELAQIWADLICDGQRPVAELVQSARKQSAL